MRATDSVWRWVTRGGLANSCDDGETQASAEVTAAAKSAGNSAAAEPRTIERRLLVLGY